MPGIMEGRSVVVTGAAQGIGFAIAEVAAKESAAVVLNDVNVEGLEAAAQRLRDAGARAVAHPGDSSNRAVAAAMVDRAVSEFGRLDALACAGFRRIHGPAETFRDEDWCMMVEQGLTGHFRCAQEAARVMLPAGTGSILFITSIASRVAVPGVVAYTAVKSGLVGLARQLGVEWARRGVRVNALAPGMTLTPGLAMPREAAAQLPSGRAVRPEEIADMAVFLLSPKAEQINGQEIAVDGGAAVGRGAGF